VWYTLNNEELHSLYDSPSNYYGDQVKEYEMAEHVVSWGEIRNEYRNLVGTDEGKNIFGRPRSRWEDSIRMVKVKIFPCF
jgi:hypothetical protein